MSPRIARLELRIVPDPKSAEIGVVITSFASPFRQHGDGFRVAAAKHDVIRQKSRLELRAGFTHGGLPDLVSIPLQSFTTEMSAEVGIPELKVPQRQRNNLPVIDERRSDVGSQPEIQHPPP